MDDLSEKNARDHKRGGEVSNVSGPTPSDNPYAERRHRRIQTGPLRGVCGHCGGPITLRVRGRDRRVVCAQCNNLPENCRCKLRETV